MRILITGAGGFVGRHLIAALQARGHETIAADRHGAENVLAMDVTDALGVHGAVELARPDAVAHLAGQAFVPASFDDPVGTFAVNAFGTQHVLDAVRELEGSPRVLVVSSADAYGPQPLASYPLTEAVAPRPASPYAASKVAAEAITMAYARSYGTNAVITRAFNHIGAGQDERFAIAGFAGQVARAAVSGDPRVLVGNLDARRDLLDVRDVCEAYALLLEGGGKAGEIYNIASGVAVSMKEALRRLVEIARIPVEIREDPARMRPSDVPLAVGDAAKLREATGWEPRIPLIASLRDVYTAAFTAARSAGDTAAP